MIYAYHNLFQVKRSFPRLDLFWTSITGEQTQWLSYTALSIFVVKKEDERFSSQIWIWPTKVEPGSWFATALFRGEIVAVEAKDRRLKTTCLNGQVRRTSSSLRTVIRYSCHIYNFVKELPVDNPKGDQVTLQHFSMRNAGCFLHLSNLNNCASDFSLLNLPKGKSLGRSKPATNS